MAHLPLVVVPDFLHEAGIESAVLDGVARVEFHNVNYVAKLPLETQHKCEVILAFHLIRLHKEDFELVPNLKAIIRIGVGYDNVDLKAAGERNIVVCNIPDYGTEEVADHALCLILDMFRKVTVLNAVVRKGDWPDAIALSEVGLKRIRGAKLGLVGFGNIGKAVAVRAKAFGFDIIFYDPYVADGNDKALGVSRVDTLDELLAISDVLSFHCFLSDETRHIFSHHSLDKIKKGAFIVNTARGPIIDETALVAGLRSGAIAAAALDVIEKEPYRDGHLSDVPNLILTPHAAFYSDKSWIELRTKAALEAKRILEGKKPRNPVNSKFLHHK